jgi:hypothetical protein
VERGEGIEGVEGEAVSDADKQHPAMRLIPADEDDRLFLLARGRAIEAYAIYEQSLARLYAELLGVSLDYAGITFFRINNARARLAIIERLIHKRHGSQYSKFWNSLRRLLRGLDERRNQIVHWTSVDEISDAGRLHTLAAPNFLDSFEQKVKVDASRISGAHPNKVLRFKVIREADEYWATWGPEMAMP